MEASDDNSPMQQVLATPELLEHILSFVHGFRGLQATYNVCRTWRSTLRRIFRERALHPWPVVSVHCQADGHVHPRDKDTFRAWVDKATVLPECMLVFVPCMEFDGPRASSFLHTLRAQIGVFGAEMLMTSGSGVFHPNHTVAVRGEGENEPYHVAIQVIPKSEDVVVDTFVDDRPLSAFELTADIARDVMFGARDAYPEPKAVFFVTRDYFEDACALAAFLKSENPSVATAGGIAITSAGSLESCDQQLYGLVLSGRNIKALSLMADFDDGPVEDVLAAAAEAHAGGMRMCMGMLICCVAWFMEQQQQDKNVQLLLEEAFPGLPSVGYFSGGELGFLDEGEREPGNPQQAYEFFHAMHQHTCVFLLVGYHRDAS